MTFTESTDSLPLTTEKYCYTCYTTQTCRVCHMGYKKTEPQPITGNNRSCCMCEVSESQSTAQQPQRTKLSNRMRLIFKSKSCRKFSFLRLSFKGMSHSLLISLVIVSTFLCSLVNGEEELKQISTLTDSEKPFKLGELLQRLKEANQAFNRERAIQQAASQEDAKLHEIYEYMKENFGSDSSDLPIIPPGHRTRPVSTLQDAKEDYLYGTDKRGNYMTLCHFKICNMGRKRWKSWP